SKPPKTHGAHYVAVRPETNSRSLDSSAPVVQDQAKGFFQWTAWLPAGVGGRARVAPHQARDVVRPTARRIPPHPHPHVGMRAQDGDHLGDAHAGPGAQVVHGSAAAVLE